MAALSTLRCRFGYILGPPVPRLQHPHAYVLFRQYLLVTLDGLDTFFPMRFLLALAIALPAALMLRPSAAAWADNGNEGDQRSPLMIALTQCRDISGADARLACYDKTTATLIEAEAKHEVVVIDRAQVKEAKRRLFGIKLPISPLFTNTPDIDNIETTLRSSSVDSGGGWTFVLADGASWTQVDGNVVAGKPKAGEKVIVQRGTLGSFKLTVGNRPAVKVRRLN